MTGFISELYRELLDWSFPSVCGDPYQVNGRRKKNTQQSGPTVFEKKEGVPRS